MRSLTEAFVRAAEGRATLLPQIRALGDLDEGEPPFEPGGTWPSTCRRRSARCAGGSSWPG
jgi:inactivated superfamily I helicase